MIMIVLSNHTDMSYLILTGNPISAIIPGEVGGNFIVDVKNGVINFTDIESTKSDGNKGLIAVR